MFQTQGTVVRIEQVGAAAEAHARSGESSEPGVSGGSVPGLQP